MLKLRKRYGKMNSEAEKYLTELEQLANEATQEPWVVYYGEEYGRTICHRIATVAIKDHGKCYSGNPKDCKFIVAAREAVPRLINMVRELETYIAQLEKEADYLAGSRYKLDCPEKPSRKISCKMNKTICQQCWREAARNAV